MEATPRRFPTRLFAETTTRCNLKCRMCVKQSGENGIPEGDMPGHVFDALKPAFPNLESLVLNGIGEPLLHPELERFIAEAKRDMPDAAWVGFQTNGRLLDEARAASLIDAGADRICLSADAVSTETFRRLREGGEQHHVDRALSLLDAERKRQGRTTAKIGVEFVLMRDNMDELPDTLRWAAARNADLFIVSHLLPYDRSLRDQVVCTPNTDASVAFFREKQREAATRGIEIARYPDIRWQYHKNEAESAIVRFVKGMVDEAERREIPFHLDNLLAEDEALFSRVSEMFEIASEIAAGEGIDLRLPAVRPARDRRCDFVEDGSLFVAWDGSVYPCYFLWHHYHCFLHDKPKVVEPKQFGKVPEEDVLAIWNGPEFVDFRGKVRLYDYPFCGNCGMGPCDLVSDPDFQADCYTIDVPCGDCPWPMGLMNCL